ncbi:MAG: hypothetical protein JW924_00655, partial [Fusobacteriaceae bacterium]|nr:hypothetical protein [Fusobacteriaceae bacterium]
MKKFFIGVPKVFFAVLCYLSALLLALLSGYFTIIFYAQSQTGWNMWAMGGLAGMLEFIKIMLAASYPFMQYRDIKREKQVLFYLKICFFLSVMASMFFFMSGGDIERSPASNITLMLYQYMPFLEVIPIKFAQFLTTMSLSILVEAFIIFLPILAPIMFIDRDYKRKKKEIADTSFDKLKEIVTIIPERIIDRLHEKVVGNKVLEIPDDKIKVVEMNNKNEVKKIENFVTDKATDDKENKINYEKLKALIVEAIYEHQNNNVCPSVNKLVKFINDENIGKDIIHDVKKELEEK